MIIILYKRKASIYQTQLTDFIGKRSIEKLDMNIPRDYRLARKKFRWIPLQANRGKQGRQTKQDVSKFQKKITDFTDWAPILKGKYLYRFPSLKIPPYAEYCESVISKKEWAMHRYLKGFKGFFENLFELNDFSYFDDVQEELERQGVSFKSLFLSDIIAYELLRINLGFKNYRGIEKMERFMGRPPLFGITHDSAFFPTAADLSYVLSKIPAHAIFGFFQLLVKECVECGIIIPRILIWDGQFIRSNCKNNKEEGKETYNDPDAGYCRHIGQKKGVGYDPGILYAFCFNRWFPVYFKMFPGNRNDTVAYRETLDQFLTITDYQWMIAIADTGPYCEQNLLSTQFKGLIPLIRAKKNLKTHPIRELKKDYFFNMEYIPKGWADEFVLKL